ncbi:D-aminoacylase [Deinococcus deserti]|uniref:Putative N-acyl-D-amino-acid deacylase n=1 Tax=Deinococcus deserti (strain DSM 17065 / CIP 109153 / LMG 22923 / VCD115) TaxID=546414 RepID=C1D448_DEIDV|nr:D-aminoacylase [Deinococcus deserti]ACO47929.2 putative N-acyl-D-amino-acid deacylase [Deinococcus deserti VCD115]
MCAFVIKGGVLIDGTGASRFPADLRMDDHRITQIALPGAADETAAEVIQADGLVVAPGFIDVMSHSVSTLLEDGRSVSKITQGITTEIMGEGWTPAPVWGANTEPFRLHGCPGGEKSWENRARNWTRFGDWMSAQEGVGASVNFGSFLGGTTVRLCVRGHAAGPSTPEELDSMRRIVRESMEDGAFGLATALEYPPGSFADTDELTVLCGEVARYGGIYSTHLRAEDDSILEALDEALEICHRSGARLHLYHLKAAGRSSWPKMAQLLQRINGIRTLGTEVYADMYLYTSAGTGLSSVLPPWASTDDRLKDRLADPRERAQIYQAVQTPDGTWEPLGSLNGPASVTPLGLRLPNHLQFNGQSLVKISEALGLDWIDTAIELILKEPGRIFTAFDLMSEDNIERQLLEPWVMPGSDAQGFDPSRSSRDALGLHPRACGNFARFLGYYVRDRGLMSLEEGVRRMTSLPARHLRLAGRGELRTGAFADVVVFDPHEIRDRATFLEPGHLSEGVHHVWVNGQPVVRAGLTTGARPGRRLHGGSKVRKPSADRI